MDRFRNEVVGVAVIVLVFGTVVALVPPTGEFPLGDDWDYAATARDLVEYGEIRLSDWPAMPLIVHVVWGALFIKIFGFSYFVLRVANLTMALVGSLTIYTWVRLIGQTRQWAVFAALFFFLNPLVLWMAYSFHTNVTNAAIMSLSLVFQLAAVRHVDRLGWFVAAGIVGALGYLVRPTGAIPTIAFAMVLSARTTSRRAAKSAAVLVPLATTVLLHNFWLDLIHGRPYNSTGGMFQWDILSQPVLHLHRLVQLLLGLGLFLSPIAVAYRSRHDFLAATHTKSFVVSGISTLGLLIVAALFSGHDLRPYTDLHVYDCGIGNDYPLPPGRTALRGLAVLVVGQTVSIFRAVTTALALISVLLIAGRIGPAVCRRGSTSRLSDDDAKIALATLGVSASSMLAVLVFVRTYFEWYLIPLLVLCGLLGTMLHCGVTNSPGVASWLVLIGIGASSATAVQDTLARNEAGWAATRKLHEAGVAPDQINAGLEYNGEFRFSPRYRTGPIRTPPYLLSLDTTTRAIHLALFWSDHVDARSFTLAYAELPNHTVELEVPFRSWMRSGRVLVLRRSSLRSAPQSKQ
jgi:hypothetical protein